MVYLVSYFGHFCVFLLVSSLFKMAPKHRAEVLSSVSKSKKAMMCLLEKIHTLDKLCSRLFIVSSLLMNQNIS